ncbi:Mitosis inhibitor protein kinase wee1, partial [Bonamia ostreae]
LAAWMENSDMYHLTPLLNSTLNDWPRCDNLKLGAIPASKLETGIWRVLQDLSSALEHIRSKGFVHVDVKPSNVLVRRGATLVWDRFLLNDFGQARPLDGTKAVKARGLGEWRYRPPEILERTASLRHDGEAVDKIESNYDIYSLGLVVLDILVGTILPLKALEKIREGNIDDFLGETKWSSKLKRLVAEMMSFEALKRPTSAEIVKKCENGILGKFSE